MAPPSSSFLALGGAAETSTSSVKNACSQHQQQPAREHIKSKSAKSLQWKENLRTECIARAKNARREKIKQARRRSTGHVDDHHAENSNGVASREDVAVNKREREIMHNYDNSNNFSNDNNQYQRMVDHIPMNCNGRVLRQISCGGVSDEGVLDTARMLVENELQRALTGLRHCEQMQQGAPSCKKTYHGLDDNDEEYKISQEEFAALLAEVTEELQRDEEFLEEELWEMERAEALERERLILQIDDYDDWEELQQQQQQQQVNVYTSPLLTNSTCRVVCPICNSASLIETPFEGIKCINATTDKQCTFGLDIASEGLSLNHLQNQLRRVYEEHSAVCLKGILTFHVDSRGGVRMLMAGCDTCHAHVVVL